MLSRFLIWAVLIPLVRVFSFLICNRSSKSIIQKSFIRQSSNKDSIDNIPQIRSAEWAKRRGMVPGYGGYWPGNPNAKKYKVTIKSAKTGEEFTAMVPEDRYIYFYFEEMGIDLPIINKVRMCRQGCCTICAAKCNSGKSKMEAPLGLLKEMRKENFVLTCATMPRSDLELVLQDEDEMYVKQWGQYFESGGVEWGGVLPEDD